MNIRESDLPEQDIRAIRSHLRWMRRSNTVRRIAADILAGRSECDNVAPLLAAVYHAFDWKWRERTVAAWALGQAPLTLDQQRIAVERLKNVLQERALKGNWILWRIAQFCLRSVPVTLVGIFMGMLLSDNWGYPENSLLLCLLVLALPFLIPFSLSVDRRRNDEARIRAAETLGKLGLPSAVASLAYGASSDSNLSSNSNLLKTTSLQALRSVLPNLQASDYGCLSSDTVITLCNFLRTPDDEVKLEILKALGKVGDENAVRPVELLAKRSRSISVKASAARVLPILYARQSQKRDPKMLLRASNATITSETLLRAASASTDHQQAETLLRASTAGEDTRSVGS